MDMAITILNQLAIMLSFLVVGWLLTKTGKLKDDKPITVLIPNAIMPAMVVGALQAPYSLTLLRDIGIAALGFFVVVAAGVVVGFLMGGLARQPASATNTWTACIATTNSIFMALPIMLALYGDGIMPLTAGIMLSFNLTTFLYINRLLEPESKGKRGVNIKRLMLQPVIVAIFVGMILFLMPFRLPAPGRAVLDLLGMMAMPLSMVVIGSQLAKCNVRETFTDAKVYLVSAGRLIIAPLLSYFMMRPFIADPVILGIVTISAVMPVATIVAVIAVEQGGDVRFCSKVVFVSTILCIFTVPILLPLLL